MQWGEGGGVIFLSHGCRSAVGSSVSIVVCEALLSGKSTCLHAHLFSQRFGSAMSQIHVGLLFSFQSIHRKETQVKQWHASAGPTSSRSHRTETNAMESLTLRSGHMESQTQGLWHLYNGRVREEVAIQLTMLNIAQLVLTIVYSENSNKFWLHLRAVGQEPS